MNQYVLPRSQATKMPQYLRIDVLAIPRGPRIVFWCRIRPQLVEDDIPYHFLTPYSPRTPSIRVVFVSFPVGAADGPLDKTGHRRNQGDAAQPGGEIPPISLPKK